MGYHDTREIPNYWTYARHFVLQDHMFEPNASWTLPSHLFMVSEWSAQCSKRGDPMSCANTLQSPDQPARCQTPDYAWTDLTYLLHQHRISWAYYVEGGTEPDCEDNRMNCAPVSQRARRPSFLNPLPGFDTVKQDDELNNIQDLSTYFNAAKHGTLPAVS